MIVPVTELEYQKGREVFERAGDHRFVSVPADEPSLAAFVRDNGCAAVVVGVVRYAGPLYEALPRGGIILRFGVGTDSIDRAQAVRRGILVANTPGALDRSVAEHTIFLIGALVRHIARGDRDVRDGRWEPRTGDELRDLKLAIVGLGAIGAQVAQIAHAGFGVETLVCQHGTEARATARLGMGVDEMRSRLGYSLWSKDLIEVLPSADIVSVHLPLRPGNEGLFDAATFARFKDGSLFVNTSRGGLVVERDLAWALRCGKLAGAALDVYENEPYEPVEGAEDLRQLPNVLMTPHVASNTRAANRRMAEMVVGNLRHWERGEMDAVHRVF